MVGRFYFFVNESDFFQNVLFKKKMGDTRQVKIFIVEDLFARPTYLWWKMLLAELKLVVELKSCLTVLIQ